MGYSYLVTVLELNSGSYDVRLELLHPDYDLVMESNSITTDDEVVSAVTNLKIKFEKKLDEIEQIRINTLEYRLSKMGFNLSEYY